MSSRFMLVPTENCQADCNYCFGPHYGGKVMKISVFQSALNWIKEINGKDEVDITFHGGEPLLAGVDFYQMVLPKLNSEFGSENLRLSMQSNLWVLNSEFIKLFKKYGVSLSTSLDGPEEINDLQRGPCYFQNTFNGIELAREHGFNPGSICTFTPKSADSYREIFDFFASNGIDFSIHAAELAINNKNDNLTLSPEDFGDLLVNFLDYYLENQKYVRVITLDSLCKSVSSGMGGICTFTDCLGSYFAIAPDGGIYPCQRFVGYPSFSMGNVMDQPSLSEIKNSNIWRMFQERQERVKEECGDCAYFDFCKGGCPYSVSKPDGTFNGFRDPYCESYKRIFSKITDKALEEVFSEENMAEIMENPGEQTLLRKGSLLSLMRGDPHPADVSRRARELILAVALARFKKPEIAAQKLLDLGVATNRDAVFNSLHKLKDHLQNSSSELLNLYLYVTFGCNLKCNHCYAYSSPENNEKSMSVENIINLTYQAAQIGFKKVVIVGGEPLVHPQRDEMLDALSKLRNKIKPAKTVLRTNLAQNMSEDLVKKVAHSTDYVVVSLDGDQDYHDSRRGKGSYNRTVANLKRLIGVDPSAEVSITAVLASDQVTGKEGEAVKELARELGHIKTRFKPLLPLGRAEEDLTSFEPDFNWTDLKRKEVLAYGFKPASSCGIGNTLYVGPEGETFPCFAFTEKEHSMPNVCNIKGLRGVIESKQFQKLNNYNIDLVEKCKNCDLRYLCGGACRAWASDFDKDLSPSDCTLLKKRAYQLLSGALDVLEIDQNNWRGVGLSLPK